MLPLLIQMHVKLNKISCHATECFAKNPGVTIVLQVS
jgi:hypothetical protein